MLLFDKNDRQMMNKSTNIAADDRQIRDKCEDQQQIETYFNCCMNNGPIIEKQMLHYVWSR